jgi:hypothetical protein
MLPTPVVLDPVTIRVYLGVVDSNTVSRIHFVDVDAMDPTRVVRTCTESVLDVGEPGMFDDNGVSPGCALVVGNELWLYYLGYQTGCKARFSIFSGLAISRDGGETFVRAQRVPVLDRTDQDMFFRSTPCVAVEGRRFRIWYAGGGRWLNAEGKLLAVSEIRHTESLNGRDWRRPEDTCVTLPVDGSGHALVRPWVQRLATGYELYYCIRSTRGYRLGYGTSTDGLTFSPMPLPPGLEPVAGAWDEEMSYPALVTAANRTYLFYSGNKWGAAGFGVACLEQTES